MNGKEALKLGLVATQNMLNMFVSDLSDHDLTVRPVPNANNIAWQIGHLIEGEPQLGGAVPGFVYPELPNNLKGYDKKSASGTPAGGYLTKAQYLEWFGKMREASIANLAKLSDADLDKPNTGAMAKFAPRYADLIFLIANHTMMHVGQFSVARRALNKPILM
jgi:hypothetical protein